MRSILANRLSPPGGTSAAALPQETSQRTQELIGEELIGERRTPLLNRRFVLAALGQAAVVSALVMVITFVLIRAVPGDPARQLLGESASNHQVAVLHRKMGLDGSLVEQFVRYVSGLLHGNLGVSLAYPGTGVGTLVLSGLATTAPLLIATLLVSGFGGTLLGIVAATARWRSVDWTVRFATMTLLAAPGALLSLLAILFVGVDLRLAPAGGWGTGFPDDLRYLWLPTLTLSCLLAPVIARAVRQRATEVLREEHIEAAIARGVSPLRLIWAHVLPNSALPVITLIGLNISGLIGGAVVVEAVFGLPGLGSKLVSAIDSHDYPVLQAIVLITGILTVLGNVSAEFAQRVLDPRSRP